MATLEARLRALSTAIGAKIKALPKTGIPNGGIADQVLAKSSATDGATYWSFPGQYPFYAEAQLAGGQTITPGSFQRILLNQVLSDDGGRLTSGGGIYVCPYDGVYLFEAVMRVQESTPDGTQVGIGIGPSEGDGTDHLWLTRTNGPRCTFNYSKLQKRSAGDQVRIFTFSDQGYNISFCVMMSVLLRRTA